MAERPLRAKDLRGLPEPDLTAKIETLRAQLWRTRVKTEEGSSQQPHHARLLRRQIARIATVLREGKRT